MIIMVTSWFTACLTLKLKLFWILIKTKNGLIIDNLWRKKHDELID